MRAKTGKHESPKENWGQIGLPNVQLSRRAGLGSQWRGPLGRYIA